MNVDWRGVFAAATTQFQPDQALDVAATIVHLEKMIDAGVHGLHFRVVARSTSLPIMVYNNPVSHSVDITPEMFVELTDQANLVAIKESSENVRRITDLKNQCEDRYTLFCGVGALAIIRRGITTRPAAGRFLRS